MKKANQSDAEQLTKKYHKPEEITNLKEMIYRSAQIYKTRIAFRKKDEKGTINKITYEQFKNDIENLGTSLIKQGFQNKRIAVIGKNSYEWCVTYLAATIVGIVVPIDKELEAIDIINFMNVSETAVILGDNKILKKLQTKENQKEIKNKQTKYIDFEKKNK